MSSFPPVLYLYLILFLLSDAVFAPLPSITASIAARPPAWLAAI
jgi:hypothetical protein